MFGIGPVEMALGLVVIFLLEIALFWAASAVADAPPMGWGKLLLVVLLVTCLSVGLLRALGVYSGAMTAPLDPENRPLVLITTGLALVVLWAVPAVLYPMLASVSILRGMWLALLQLMLRAFLYVFLVAIAMVVLAVIQIFNTTEPHAERADPSRQVVFYSVPR
jgi:hypothetical protein